MAKARTVTKTVPNGPAGPSRKIQASAAQVVALETRKAIARRMAEEERASRRAEAVDAARHVDNVAAAAKAQGEEVATRKSGERVVLLSRDGLEWLNRKGDLSPAHYQAGLRFRGHYELANGTGVPSCLASEGQAGGAFGPRDGATQAMIVARGLVEGALKALGTPLLRPYVVGVAGEGRTLAQAAGVDVKRTDDHKLPCRIAFDLLARHYGMIGGG